jgi:hypothetical protein
VLKLFGSPPRRCDTEDHRSALPGTSSLERWEIGLGVHVNGTLPAGSSLAVRMQTGDQLLVKDTYTFVGGGLGGADSAGELYRSISLSDPGIEISATTCCGARLSRRSLTLK